MRIIRTVIVVFLISVFVLMPNIGCSARIERKEYSNNGKEIVAYTIAEHSDAINQEVGANECEDWSYEKCNPFNDSSAERNKTVKFDGVLYKGEYWYSIVEFFDTYQSDYYEFDGGWFSVNAQSGDLVSIVILDTQEGNKTLDECKKEAMRIAEQYIDIDEYEFSMTEGEYINSYYFQRFINGSGTCSRVSVGIGTDGNIVTFTCQMSNELEELIRKEDSRYIEDAVERFTSKEAHEVIDKKIRSVYKDTAEYEIIDSIMVILEDDSIGMVYTVDVDWLEKVEGEDDEYMLAGTRTYILVKES